MASHRPHGKLVKHYHEPGDLHELTFSCYHQLPLLTNDAWRRQLARSLDLAGEEFKIELAAFVFMPDHVHLLVAPIGPDPAIDQYLAQTKQPFSKWVKQQLVSAKSHEFDDKGFETRTDYRKMMKIVVDSGYRGYVGIEYEGSKHPEVEGVLLTKALLEEVRSELSKST